MSEPGPACCCARYAAGYACDCIIGRAGPDDPVSGIEDWIPEDPPGMSLAEANALQMLAADNARMCEIVIAADKLAKALALPADSYGERARAIRTALDAYKQARNGQ